MTDDSLSGFLSPSSLPNQAILRTFLASARLTTYVAEQPTKLRVGPLRVLGHADTDLGLVYIDTYYASEDDTYLYGTELVMRPSISGALRINYRGGFRPVKGCSLTSRQVLDEILKPCRRDVLTGSRTEQEGRIGDVLYRYRWIMASGIEREEIVVCIEGQWVLIHQITFEEDLVTAPPATLTGDYP